MIMIVHLLLVIILLLHCIVSYCYYYLLFTAVIDYEFLHVLLCIKDVGFWLLDRIISMNKLSFFFFF